MEDFVTYEQAVALKKLGFKEECFYFYNIFKEFAPNPVVEEFETVNDALCSVNSESEIEIVCDAPTLAQAQKWLRKEKHYYIDCLHVIANNWTYEISDDNGSVKYNEYMLVSFEEALSTGITECLKLLES